MGTYTATQGTDMILKGQIVKIKPECQDPGDAGFVWMAVEDEDGGRVRISPVNIDMEIKPTMVVKVADLIPQKQVLGQNNSSCSNIPPNGHFRG